MSQPAFSEFLADLDARFPPDGSTRPEVVSSAPQLEAGSAPPLALPADTGTPRPFVAANPIPWAQQPGETDTAYGRFRAYVAMGEPGPDGLPKPRSLTQLAASLNLSPNTVHHLSSRFGWVARVQAWDKRDRSGDFQADVHDLARRMVRVASASVAGLEESIADGRNPVARADGTADVRTLANVIQQMNQTLRLNAGLSSENVSSHVHVHGQPSAAKASLAAAYESTVRGRPLARSFLRRFLSALAGAAIPETDPEFEHASALVRAVPYARDGSSAQRVEHLAGLLKAFPFEGRAQQAALIKAAEYLSAQTRTKPTPRSA